MFLSNRSWIVFDKRILVVSINGLDSPKFESVTIPACLPESGTDFFFSCCNANETKFIESFSPNEAK